MSVREVSSESFVTIGVITDDDGNCIKFFADPAQPTACVVARLGQSGNEAPMTVKWSVGSSSA